MIFRLIAAGMLAIWATGCATALPSGRKGLLEDGAAIHSTASAPRRVGRAVGAHLAGGGMGWPLQQVQITSQFGKRGQDFHEGIDLRAATGTSVLAAMDGVVIYSGHRIRGYGKLVVVRHHRQLSTIYAHNSKLLVRVGQAVQKGQKIAISGKSGHVTGPHLHFEVRDGLAALDPLDFLAEHHAADLLGPPKSIALPSSRGRAQKSGVKTHKVAANTRVLKRAAATLVESEQSP